MYAQGLLRGHLLVISNVASSVLFCFFSNYFFNTPYGNALEGLPECKKARPSGAAANQPAGLLAWPRPASLPTWIVPWSGGRRALG